MSRICDTLWIVNPHSGTQCPHCGVLPGEYHREREADDVCTRCGETREKHPGAADGYPGFAYSGDCPDGERRGFTMVQPKPEPPRTRWQRFTDLITGATP